MKTRFFDRQDDANPLNGAVISDRVKLRHVLAQLGGRAPFFAELIGDNGFKLLLGLGSLIGCAQFSSVDGDPPYLMAVDPDLREAEGELDFLIGGTLTPVPRRYCLPRSTIQEIASVFVRTGQRKADVSWEEI